MKANEQKPVELRRAAALLGISESDLCQISCETGLGRKESHGPQEQMYFTYEELRQICLHCVQGVH